MKKRIPIIILFLVLVGFGVWLLLSKTRLTETGALQLHGNVDIREVNLGFRVSGRLLEVKRDEGDAVKAGESLSDQPPDQVTFKRNEPELGLRSRRPKRFLVPRDDRDSGVPGKWHYLRDHDALAVAAKLFGERVAADKGNVDKNSIQSESAR